MWTSYSARHAAQLIGLPESAVRSCIRDGLVGTGGAVPAQLTFRDLSVLRMIKALVDAGVPIARVRRELVRLQVDHHASISELTIEADAGGVRVRGVPELASQLVLPFVERPRVEPSPPGEVHVMPRPADAPNPAPALPATVEQWLARGAALEERDPVTAIDAYRRALRLRPECAEAWINLGRLFSESGDVAAAQDCFKSAIDLDPGEATAFYNLGVLAQDAGREREAIDHYHRALELDPHLAEAHYNLATLFDQAGDSRQAIRHINEYRKLTPKT
ncbi:MAG: tetratricopeptide repeat protein [Proteobacteria bacterium]|nr:tetratricopeptide repeat protein [Pseudomonadota bacterium]